MEKGTAQNGGRQVEGARGALQEISQFVAANWVELQDSETGSRYFYNQITHRTQFDKPVQPQKVRLPSLGASRTQIMHALQLRRAQGRPALWHVTLHASRRRLTLPLRLPAQAEPALPGYCYPVNVSVNV